METLRLAASEPDSLSRALAILRAGGLVAFPTDTVYGMGALAFDGRAVESIYAAKDRPVEKAVPILIGDAEELEKVAARVPHMARLLAAHFWPGPLSLVVPRLEALPEAVSTDDTVAVREPDHPVARALLHLAGPMAVTSANISGEASPTTAHEVFNQLGGRIPLILDGGRTPGGIPSTVVDCTGENPQLLRPGPITWAQLTGIIEGS